VAIAAGLFRSAFVILMIGLIVGVYFLTLR